jgi:hypothetical protein
MTWSWSIGFAALSALIWIAAAFVPIPKSPWLVLGAGGGRPSPELDAILHRLRLQSYLNAAAAFSMAVSVFFQFEMVMTGTDRNGGCDDAI